MRGGYPANAVPPALVFPLNPFPRRPPSTRIIAKGKTHPVGHHIGFIHAHSNAALRVSGLTPPLNQPPMPPIFGGGAALLRGSRFRHRASLPMTVDVLS